MVGFLPELDSGVNSGTGSLLKNPLIFTEKVTGAAGWWYRSLGLGFLALSNELISRLLGLRNVRFSLLRNVIISVSY